MTCVHSQHSLTAISWCRAHSFLLASQNMQSVSSAFTPLIPICSALLVKVACPCGMLTNMPVRVSCSRFLCKYQVGPKLEQSFAESMRCMTQSSWCHTASGCAISLYIALGQNIHTAQHSTAQHSTAQHSTAQHSMAKACSAQPSIALYSCPTAA